MLYPADLGNVEGRDARDQRATEGDKVDVSWIRDVDCENAERGWGRELKKGDDDVVGCAEGEVAEGRWEGGGRVIWLVDVQIRLGDFDVELGEVWESGEEGEVEDRKTRVTNRRERSEDAQAQSFLIHVVITVWKGRGLSDSGLFQVASSSF